MTDMRGALAGPRQPGRPEVVSQEDVLSAASRGQLDRLRDLVDSGAAHLGPDKDGRTPLHVAAQEGQFDVCKFLLARGCHVDVRDMMGYTPLLRAASHGAQDVAQLLLETGCDVNVQDEHGNAAIHEACWNGFSKTAELLVKHDCDVFLTNKAGFTALHLAAQNGHNESSRVLLYAGCNADLKNNYGDTALHTAARYGHAGVARILLSAKCKLNEQNKNGDTALHISSALKRRKIAKILVESGVDTELLNKQSERAIDVARRKEHPEIELIITTCVKPRTPSAHRRQHGVPFNVTFKDDLDFEDGPVVCPEDQPPLKPEPKPEKERKFFFFRKKKKDKEKEKTKLAQPATSESKKGGECSQHHQHHKKSAVTGFFSQYMPREGVQLYRDLAGNIKQGPIGYAPVCQCGPSLKRLENTITDTKDTLYNHIDTSHQVLAQRIENLDIRTSQQAYASNAMLQDHLLNERDSCHAHISELLDEERRETYARLDHTNSEMRDKLELWLNDKLASYGHCLDHHHDDSALPPRNLFLDFPTMGQLVRAHSDETLSASDYSGKHRKKDFYASRQAAMQQIRGWDIPPVGQHKTSVLESGRSRPREKNNNTVRAKSATRVVTEAQVHVSDSGRARTVEREGFSKSQDPLSPSTNSTTSPGTANSQQNLRDGYGGVGSRVPSEDPPRWDHQQYHHQPRQPSSYREGRPFHHNRVSFSPNVQDQQQKQHYSQHHPHRSSTSPQPHSVPFPHPSSHSSHRPPSRLSQADSTSHHASHFSPNPNLPTGGPPRNIPKSGELGDSQDRLQDTVQPQNTSYFRRNSVDVLANHRGHSSPQQPAMHQKDTQYSRIRTPSIDSVLEDGQSNVHSIARSRSVENTLEDSVSPGLDGTAYSSGYVTDSALRSNYHNRNSRQALNFRSVRASNSASPANRNVSSRYQVPQTPSKQILGNSNESATPYRNTQYHNRVPPHGSHYDQTDSRYNHNEADNRLHYLPWENHLYPNRAQHRSIQGLNNSNTSGNASQYYGSQNRYFPSTINSVYKSDPGMQDSSQALRRSSECLQHSKTVVSPRATPSPAFATVGNKEDSTCSSNQDSGYGSRNHGGRVILDHGVMDTSAGTPSSSFSIGERSACNTPSHGGSSNGTQNELLSDLRLSLSSPHQQRPYHNDTDYNGRPGSTDRSFQSRDSPQLHANGPNAKFTNSFHSPRQGNSINSPRANVNSNGADKFPLRNASINPYKQDSNSYSSFRQSQQSRQGQYLNPTNQTSNYYNNTGYKQPVNHITNGNHLNNSYGSQTNGQTTRHSIAHKDAFSSPPQPSRGSDSPQDKNPVTNSAVQAHVQGWYQRRLKEAAQRLRDNHLYDNPSPTEVNDQGKQMFSYNRAAQMNGSSGQQNVSYHSNYSPNQETYSKEDHSVTANYLSQRRSSQVNEEPYRSDTVSNLRDRFDKMNLSQQASNNNENFLDVSNHHAQMNGYDRQRSDSYYHDETLTSGHQNRSENVNSFSFTPYTRDGYRYDPMRGSDV